MKRGDKMKTFYNVELEATMYNDDGEPLVTAFHNIEY